MFWDWFNSNRDMHLFTIRKWFIKASIEVDDLERIFVILFGPQTPAL